VGEGDLEDDVMYSPSLVRETSPEMAVNTFKDTLRSMVDAKFQTFADSGANRPLADMSLREILKIFCGSVNSSVSTLADFKVKYTPINFDQLISSLLNFFESAMNYSRNNKLIDAYVKCMEEPDYEKQQSLLRNIALEFFEISTTYGELVCQRNVSQFSA
jgi:hypothetical protein